MKPGTIRFIGASAANNGITAYVGNDEHIHPANTITVSYNGSVGEAFYQADRFWASDDINVFYAMFSLNETRALYFLPLIKQQGKRYTYSDKWTKEKMEEARITLPVVSKCSRQIDFAYIDAFVGELKHARVWSLGKHLADLGLDNCRLTAREQRAFDDWRNGEIKTQRRKVVDVFDVANTHCVLGEWIEGRTGSVPYVTASSSNNSVSARISYSDEFLDRGNAIVIGGKTFVVTYQSEDFFSNDSHNLVLRLKDTKKGVCDVYLYLIAAINAGLSAQYSWGDSVSYKKIQKDEIVIPVTASGEIDYDFMVLFVRAIIKRTIRGVVEWKNREIAADATERVHPVLREIGEALKFREYLPLYSYRAACGKFGEGESVEPLGWIRVDGLKGLNERLFVLRVQGHSMEPKIADGSYCVFEAPEIAVEREGRVLLVQYRGESDPETGGAYTVKRYVSKDSDPGLGDDVMLKPINKDYKAMRISPSESSAMEPIAMFVRSL